MSINTLAASHAREKGRPDATFGIVKNAKNAIARFGKDNVVDATIGVLIDDEGNFAIFPTVDKVYRNLPSEQLMDYASPDGIPEFQKAVIDFTFQGKQPKNTFVKALATPGGSGAVRNVIFNYVEAEQKFLIPDWCWGPYRDMAAENLRGVVKYEMFDDNLEFTLSSLKNESKKLLEAQDSLMVIFNTPAHNPSGYSMTDNDWSEVMGFYKKCAEDKSKKIIILVDMAYIDYVEPAEDARSFMKYFSDLPDNILITMAFSMSKSFLVYGMRSGALIGLSSSEEIVEEFFRVNIYSNRATWSNGSRGAQKLLADIISDDENRKKTDFERSELSKMLKKRASIFIKEAKEVELPMLPYHSGFFITIPTKDPIEMMKRLNQVNVYMIPLEKGIRIAISAVPTKLIPGVATKIKEALNSMSSI